jgi:hypothetical protein
MMTKKLEAKDWQERSEIYTDLIKYVDSLFKTEQLEAVRKHLETQQRMTFQRADTLLKLRKKVYDSTSDSV